MTGLDVGQAGCVEPVLLDLAVDDGLEGYPFASVLEEGDGDRGALDAGLLIPVALT